MKIGFGLDLAGYTKGKWTVLAKLESTGKKANVEILTSSPFSAKLGKNTFLHRISLEASTLEFLLDIGPVAVDVPIDLQGLPFRENPAEAWELDKREIDKVVNGLPPFASRLGSCVTRFQILLTNKLKKQIGRALFEAYPAASLSRIFSEREDCTSVYKSANKEKKEDAKLARKELCKKLKIQSTEFDLTHDEIDATICAITAVASPHDLVDERDFALKKSVLPSGYRILAQNPFEEIRVRKCKYDEWAAKK